MKWLDTLASIVPDYEPNWGDVMALPEPYRDGSFVAVYGDASHQTFICYGKIISRDGNSWVDDYSYRIQVCQSKRIVNAWGWVLAPASPEDMRLGFVQIEGGFPEFRRKP